MTGEMAQALRNLLRRPGLAAVIVLTLGLGLGAASTFVSIAYSILLRPLPFPDPLALVMLAEDERGQAGESLVSSYPAFEDWKERSRSFAAMGAARTWGPTLRLATESVRLLGAQVSQDFFTTLGAKPTLGRLLLPQDFRPDGAPAVVLSQRLWRLRFGSDPRVVGRTLSLDGALFTVVGILPAAAPLTAPLVAGQADVVAPLLRKPQWLRRGNRILRVVARLHAGVTPSRAGAEMRGLAAAMERQFPDSNAGWSASARPLRELTVGRFRPVLLVLLGAALLVLLTACANVAILLLVRTNRRRREFAVRLALGASPWRFVRQLLLEGAPLVLLGALLALLLIRAGWSTFTALVPAPLANLMGLDLGWWMLAVAGLGAACTLVAIQLAPAFEAARVPPVEMLTENSPGAGEGPRSRRTRGVIVAAEVALAIVLVTEAGLLLHSLLRLARVDLGFQPEHALVVELSLPESKYQEPRQAEALFETLRRDLGGWAGVRSLGFVSNLPLKQGNMSTGVGIQPGSWLGWMIDLRGASPGYFAALGIPLLKGRDFTSRDGVEDRPVVILNTTAASRLWPPGQDPVGRRVRLNWDNPEPREVIGLVASVHHEAIDRPPRPEAYLPFERVLFWSQHLVIRTAGDPLHLLPAVRRQVRKVDPDLTIVDAAPLEQIVASTVADRRIYTRVLAAFAAVSALLTVVGVSAVASFVTAARRRELGLRIALGAQARHLLGTALWQGFRPVALGIVLGLSAAYVLSRFLAEWLFEVGRLDPLVFLLVPLTLAGCALLAIYLPARRALRLDPARAIREG